MDDTDQEKIEKELLDNILKNHYTWLEHFLWRWIWVPHSMCVLVSNRWIENSAQKTFGKTKPTIFMGKQKNDHGKRGRRQLLSCT